jgi:hypothetical protein
MLISSLVLYIQFIVTFRIYSILLHPIGDYVKSTDPYQYNCHDTAINAYGRHMYQSHLPSFIYYIGIYQPVLLLPFNTIFVASVYALPNVRPLCNQRRGLHRILN